MFLKNNHQIQLEKLSSGSQLLNVMVPDFPLALVSVWLMAGSRFDPVGKEGLAHFFEHLLMTKTKDYSDRSLRIKQLESLGIQFNAFTGRESVQYYQVSLPDKIYQSLDFIIDGLQNSIFTQADVEKEKSVIINELLLNRNDPEQSIRHIRAKALWPNSRLGRDFFGDGKTINSISLQDILDFKNTYYIPDNVIFVIISGLKNQEIKKYIEKRYGQARGKKSGVFTEEHFTNPVLFMVDKRPLDQVTLSFNYKTTTIVNLKDIIALSFVRDYLANSWISRLVGRLRLEKDLTYWVDGVTEYFSDTGLLSFIYSVRPDAVKESIDIVFQEIEKLKKIKIKPAAMAVSKISYASYFVRKFSDANELLWWYDNAAVLGGRTISPYEYLSKIKKISPEDVLDVANKYLIKENFSLALIGPVGDISLILP